MAYAEGTDVGVEKSQQEIARIVRRYGADGFVSGWQGDKVMVEFYAEGRRVRFVVTTPSNVEDFALTDSGKRRPESAMRTAMEQEHRRRWRCLALVIKAKLEAVESGIVSFETEFLPNIVMQDGRTVAEHVVPAVARAYQLGQVSGELLAIDS